MKKPLDVRTSEHIEPAHRYEVNLEPDDFTEEKYASEHIIDTSPDGKQIRSLCHLPNKHTWRKQVGVLATRISKISLLWHETEFSLPEWIHTETWVVSSMLSFRWTARGHGCLRSFTYQCKLGIPHVSSILSRSEWLAHRDIRYHQDVVEWNFGKTSALREIELALSGGYRYYYMGKRR